MPDALSLPLIADRHTHVSLYAALQGCPTLDGASREEALALLRAQPSDRLGLVLGWHSGRLPFSQRDLAGLPPVVIVNFSLHGFLLTEAAGEILRETEPELVACHRDPEWSERNLPRLLALFGRLAVLTPEKLDAFMEGLEALGVGAAEDMLLTSESAWHVMRASRWAARLRFWATPERFQELSGAAGRDCEGLKLFLDGALGARTAALSEPFLGGAEGLLMHTDAGLLERLAGLHALRRPLAIHAIGDCAIEQAVTALERLDTQGLRFPSVRLEHVQFITEEQAKRARTLGLTLSMQPNFTSDSADYADRLPSGLLAANNPFRMLIDRCGFRPGADLILGSDGMPHGLEHALQWSLFPPFEGQRLALPELLAGYGAEGEGGAFRVEIDGAGRRVKALPPA